AIVVATSTAATPAAIVVGPAAAAAIVAAKHFEGFAATQVAWEQIAEAASAVVAGAGAAAAARRWAVTVPTAEWAEQHSGAAPAERQIEAQPRRTAAAALNHRAVSVSLWAHRLERAFAVWPVDPPVSWQQAAASEERGDCRCPRL